MKKIIFLLVIALAIVSCAPAPKAPTLPVLFENGQWAPELGTIMVTTPLAGAPGANESWGIENGMLRITNTVPGTRNIPFRWVFENTIDIRGYDAVVMELEEAPNGFFRGVLRFRIDQHAAFDSENHTNIIRMSRETYNVIPPNIGFGIGNMDMQRFRGVGALPDYGETVRIRRIFLEGDGVITTATISQRNIMDIWSPRTGNKPVTEITTSPQYTGTVEWYPNHETFQPNTVYTATITLTPRHGWTFEGVPANWFRVFDRTGSNEDNTLVHEAGANVLTRTFPATIPVEPYPTPTQFVALTIDDTPSSYTHKLLDALKENNMRVLFFVSGINMEKANTNPEFQRAIDRIIAEGHEISHHAWQHERWDNNANVEVMRADFIRNHELIREVTGSYTQWMRFPYFSGQSNALEILGELGLTHLGGPDLGDWNADNPGAFLLNRILTLTGNNRLKDGQIYVLHDQQGQTNLVQAIPEIAHELRLRGFDFMTATQLREHKNFPVQPGVSYHNFSHEEYD